MLYIYFFRSYYPKICYPLLVKFLFKTCSYIFILCPVKIGRATYRKMCVCVFFFFNWSTSRTFRIKSNGRLKYLDSKSNISQEIF